MPIDDAELPPPRLFRELGALYFDIACQRTKMGAVELTGTLRQALGRKTLSRQTVSHWRKGTQDVPVAAIWAAVRIARTHPWVVLGEIFEEHPELREAVVPPNQSTDLEAGVKNAWGPVHRE